ncbi:D-alanyl-D-alanine carboxypeptidase [Actinocorallia herbida]|uniref:D-alanyl-D-alanine carboxypeptidase n=1 Tax=Actinocorallia herbida TaxID=58109 RepID=A0A3N1CWL8_9ACTN|nr:serine hydrolase domain-containing protein [Actinocorallia herbida]ROO85666.1 D-alanyl-D-alanine carboxypeptidase [Actinocorallia herbida]
MWISQAEKCRNSRAGRRAGAAFCAVVLTAGCVDSRAAAIPHPNGPDRAVPGNSTPRPPALKTIDPAAFQAVVDTAAKALRVPGAVVLVRTPQGAFTAATGTTERGKSTPPTADTAFRIASNTKTLTSALVLLLAQDGALRLDDRVSAWVPETPNGRNITIEQLLTMRSGLYNYTDAPALAKSLDAHPKRPRTPQEMLDLAFRHPPEFPPGTSYGYSNTNYVLLGLIAEKAGGRPLARQFEDRLLRPLGLRRTSLPAPTDTSLPAPYSHGYMYGGTSYALVDQQYPAALRAAAEAGTLQPTDYTHQNPSYATAAGGAVSTAADLATWIRALTTGKVLNPDSQRRWIGGLRPEDPAAPDGQKYGYGIAYQRFGPQAAMHYHGGELPGFNSFIGHDTANDVTLVVWTNLTVSLDGKATAIALLPTVLDEIYTGLSLAPTPSPTPTS